ncbi:MAG: bifunctional folylpolyglutamate synthase/dihydrofolate synthase [Actinomycetota bacterium]|nr:bifunctional folylpolyglutamate synthase/dihydrofolate synthase [Actinomycetota bacterium]
MKYSQAVDYLDSKVVLGVKPSLERIKALCDLMGNPQKSYDSIHITGTNGKTSVARMASSILMECGFAVGLYTSPHLETVRERICVNGKLISVDDFARTLDFLLPLVEEAETAAGEELTYFEVVTAIAYSYFQEKGVDVAVFEVGMGGRWDATNLVEGEVAVITNIEMDHMSELGRTKKEIASEKVGIIKEGSILITAEAEREMLMAIARRCHDVGAEMKVFGRDFKLVYCVPYLAEGEAPSQYISVLGLGERIIKDIRLPLMGKHQAVNAACAIVAAQCYTDPRLKTSEDCFKRALQKTTIPGRLEILSTSPLVVCDGAHNAAAAQKLASTLISDFEYENLVLVVSISSDKDARGILFVLGRIASTLILTESRSSRALPADKLERFCRMEGIDCIVEPDFSKAMKLAYNSAGTEGMICVTGSLFTVAESKIFFKRQKASKEMRQDR